MLSGLGFCSPDKATAAVREPSLVVRVPGIHVTAQGGFIGLWRGNQRQKIKRPQQRALAGKKRGTVILRLHLSAEQSACPHGQY